MPTLTLKTSAYDHLLVPSSGAPWRRNVLAVLLIIGLAFTAGCGLQIPRDPDGTLDQVSGGVLRVGVSSEPGLAEIDDEHVASGPLVELASGFAASVDAEPAWVLGSEESLVEMLENGELDLAIGGFTDTTPWQERAGLTRGYTAIPGSDGRALVMLVPLGENHLLSSLETFLDREVGE